MLDKKYFEETIQKDNGTVIFKTSDGNASTQFQQAMELIDKGVDVLVIVASNVNLAASIVREAHKKNIQVIAYDRMIRNCDLDFFVGFDNIYTGRLQAEYALKYKPGGNYVIIGGDFNDMNAQYIDSGQNETLRGKIASGEIKILYKVFIDGWSPSEAEHETEQVIKLSGNKIDAVLTANDGTASGAIKALNKYKLLNNVIVTGLDAELDACIRIAEGKQSMTVYPPIKELATNAAQLAINLARKQSMNIKFTSKNNGRIDVPALVFITISVDKSNLESTVIKDGVFKKEEIYIFSN
jgi:D-xylose ABC transporter substrate-binding protein